MRNADTILTALHYALDEGDHDQAGRLVFEARRNLAGGADWTADDRDWLADLASIYHAANGSWSHAGRNETRAARAARWA